jgi:hypothetical protein
MAVVGAAWWLLLTPSFLGLMAMVAGAFLALRGQPPAADSTSA